MGLKDMLKQPLVRKFHKEYEQAVKESLDSFEAFMDRKMAEEANIWSNLSSDTRDAIEVLQKDLLFLQITPGTILEGAKKTFARYFYNNPEAVLAYADEFFNCDGGINTSFKPDWSPDSFLNRFYFDGLIVVRRSIFEKEVPEWCGITEKKQWWKEIAGFLKVKNGFNKMNSGSDTVLHIPQVLYKRSEMCGWSVPGCADKCMDNQEVDTRKTTCVTNNDNGDKTLGISIIIPSKDHPELLEKCIRSIRQTVENTRLQIIVVDNGSSAEKRKKIEVLAESMNFKYIYKKMPFNFSAMCNIGAANAIEEQLLFLNDDIECAHKGWLEDMSDVVARHYVGAVGSKLLYPDGKRIQHAGITNLPIGPVHKLQFLDDKETYYDEYNRGVRNVLAVTGACLLIRREVYEEVGGMSEDLAVAFNDVDLCFKLYEKGYYQVVLQDKPLYHHESLSRGDDETSEKWQRLMKERTTLYGKHPALEGVDPFYNKNLNRNGLDVHILPEYEQGRQDMIAITPSVLQGGLPADAREDKCLLLRAEICRETVGDSSVIELYGYGVVLGSDNALFNKDLLLKKEDGTLYRIPLKGQYRADLVRNMPDQINVAMSGFWVNVKKSDLPAGTYEVGMYASDRTSRTKLYTFVGRTVNVQN